jgi:hypothetical protein
MNYAMKNDCKHCVFLKFSRSMSAKRIDLSFALASPLSEGISQSSKESRDRIVSHCTFALCTGLSCRSARAHGFNENQMFRGEKSASHTLASSRAFDHDLDHPAFLLSDSRRS